VIQTQDVRIDGYIEAIAKKLLGALALDGLWIKDIVGVTRHTENPDVI